MDIVSLAPALVMLGFIMIAGVLYAVGSFTYHIYCNHRTTKRARIRAVRNAQAQARAYRQEMQARRNHAFTRYFAN